MDSHVEEQYLRELLLQVDYALVSFQQANAVLDAGPQHLFFRGSTRSCRMRRPSRGSCGHRGTAAGRRPERSTCDKSLVLETATRSSAEISATIWSTSTSGWTRGPRRPRMGPSLI
jgi:hypothetical protein